MKQQTKQTIDSKWETVDLGFDKELSSKNLNLVDQFIVKNLEGSNKVSPAICTRPFPPDAVFSAQFIVHKSLA